MGGIFGVASKEDCVMDLFFGTDYHSHLGTRRGGMAVYGAEGFQRSIHNIENSPFRTKFERDVEEMHGNSGIGAISDNYPQPLLIQSHLGEYAIATVGKINNKEQLIRMAFDNGHIHFMGMSSGKINSTELTAALVNQKTDLVDGILYAQELIEGSMSILILTPEGIYASRDRYGRTPVVIGEKDGAYCVSFESFAYVNLGYRDCMELGPGEVVRITADGVESLSPAQKKMKICSFLWVYYGYPTSSYEGINVEEMRYRCGEILASRDMGCKGGCPGCVGSAVGQDACKKVVASGACGGRAAKMAEAGVHADIVAGVPDSGTAHAIGYANASGVPFARPFIKYTPTWPRSFMPQNQNQRDLIARMKLIPVDALIRGKSLLLIDDSIVRGTQLGGTTEFLYQSGAKEVHIRPACPPLLFGCKYLNFSRSKSDLDLITRRVILDREGENVSQELLEDYANPDSQNYAEMIEEIRRRLNFTTLKYHRLDDLIESIGLPEEKLCTYCWSGRE